MKIYSVNDAEFKQFGRVINIDADELIKTAEKIPLPDSGAESVAPGSDGLIFNPYLNGELTPYADPKLCASFFGVRSGHTKAHFTRAVLEGVSMSILDCKNALENIGIPHEDTTVIIGGGGKTPFADKAWTGVGFTSGIADYRENKYIEVSLYPFPSWLNRSSGQQQCTRGRKPLRTFGFAYKGAENL